MLGAFGCSTTKVVRRAVARCDQSARRERAADDGVEVEYIRKPKYSRKEDRNREILAERGTHLGLVHIFSAMELVRLTVRGTTSGQALRICAQTTAVRLLLLRYRAFKLFDDEDQTLSRFCAAVSSSFRSFRNRSLREHLGRFRSSPVSRLLKRLRLHRLIKKIGKTYKFYLTELGRHVAVAGLNLKSLFLVPELASAALPH